MPEREPGSGLTVRPHTAVAIESGADALLIDLCRIEGDESPPVLASAVLPRLIARIGVVDRPAIGQALSAAMAIGAEAVALPVAHGRDVAHLGALLAVHEAESGRTDGATRIVALLASAAGALNAASLVGASPRLAGIGWDAEAVAAELGAAWLDASGGWSAPLAQVRGLVRLAAAAAGVEAIEAAYSGEEAGFARHLAAARRDGFGAVLATNPFQVRLIREA